MDQYHHELPMKVRDYECDLQGIVNNANYQHYLEHARHEFLLSRGISFARLHSEGIDAVVSAITMRFKLPLKSGDEFVVRTSYVHDKFKYIFHQDIYRSSDMRLAVRAQVDTVCVVNGQLSEVDIL
ncbi:MAG: acyl-CoA thioesterase [Bacteroidaceae bacterium]|nr:acyl-CoA thioesterase [Bacteroidaceae bacterium]